jgi:secreted Zn-dependent insulinase-like peptidase
VEVKVEGFYHKLPVLAQRIFAALAKGTFPKAAFDSVKEALQRKYRNTGMQVQGYCTWYLLCGSP